MATFKVTVKGLNGLQATLAATTSEIRAIISQEVEAAAQQWRSLAVKDAPVDQGTLKGAISYRMESEYIAEIVCQVFYAPFMEFGTKGKYRPIPGTEQIAQQFKGFKGGDFQTFLRNILKWVRRKGLAGRFSVKTRRRVGNKAVQQVEDLSVAWPIAMSILKNGVKPHPFFFKQQEVVWPKMLRNMERRIRQVSKVNVTLPGAVRRPKIVTI